MHRILYMLFFLASSFISQVHALNPVYICTASDEHYFPCLINLVGSLHQQNFNEINEIAVFDLGLNPSQRQYLSSIQNLHVYEIEITSPDLLKRFNTRTWGKPVPGWYAWKAVVLKQAFDLYPEDSIVLWIDAGSTILANLLPLFYYIQEHGYFFHDGSPWPMRRQTTQFVINAFGLKNSPHSWIISEETSGMEAGFMGITKKIYDTFIYPMYKLTFDLRYFADDGTCPNGFGECRHDQTLFSIFALTNNYRIFHHFKNPTQMLSLDIDGKLYPFHIACNPEDRIPQTTVYRARFDVNPEYFSQFIHYKAAA